MSEGLVETSKIFQDGKTWVPVRVRNDLGLKDGDTVVWLKRADGWLVKGSVEVVARLFRATLEHGGIRCPKCKNVYDVTLPRCPRCGTSRP